MTSFRTKVGLAQLGGKCSKMSQGSNGTRHEYMTMLRVRSKSCFETGIWAPGPLCIA
jgi:hypothetical protein